nr:hypothetical protein [Halomonas socia]
MVLKNVEGIILTDEEKAKKKYVSEMQSWISQYEWDYFVTLTYKHPVKDRIKVTHHVEEFSNRLSRKSFGSRSKKRVCTISVIEHHWASDSLHVHMLIKDPQPSIANDARQNSFNIRDAVITSWLESSSSSGNPALSSDGDEWLKGIDDINRVVEYMLKEFNPHASELVSPVVWDQACLDGRRDN